MLSAPNAPKKVRPERPRIQSLQREVPTLQELASHAIQKESGFETELQKPTIDRNKLKHWLDKIVRMPTACISAIFNALGKNLIQIQDSPNERQKKLDGLEYMYRMMLLKGICPTTLTSFSRPKQHRRINYTPLHSAMLQSISLRLPNARKRWTSIHHSKMLIRQALTVHSKDASIKMIRH